MNQSNSTAATKPIITGIPKIMEAAVLAAPGNFEIREMSTPEIGEDEILFKTEGCGLCASNIPVYEGRDWFSYPIEAGNPGHEAWGRVVKIGSKVRSIQVGDRIAALSYNGFAQYDKASENRAVRLPDELAETPFPGEPLGCAMNIFERSDIREGQTVAIIGIGFLGALLIQLAKNNGARVIALSQRSFSLKTAMDCGADEIIPLDDHYRVIKKVKSLTEGKFCARVIEATGKEWPLNLAAELCAERGKLTVAGFHQDGMRSVNMQLWNWRGLDVINAHEREEERYISGIEKAVEAVVKNELNPYPLFTHSFKANRINEAFQHLVNRPEGFMKAIITFNN